jgi:hypothetical protein
VPVIGGGCEAVFPLDCPAGPVQLRENYGFSSGQLAAIAAELTAQIAHLCSAWERIHGTG